MNVGSQALRLSDHQSISLEDRILAQYCIVNRDWVGVFVFGVPLIFTSVWGREGEWEGERVSGERLLHLFTFSGGFVLRCSLYNL